MLDAQLLLEGGPLLLGHVLEVVVLDLEVLVGPLLGVGEFGLVDVVLTREDELGLHLVVVVGHRCDSFTRLMVSTPGRVIGVSMRWASLQAQGEVVRGVELVAADPRAR